MDGNTARTSLQVLMFCMWKEWEEMLPSAQNVKTGSQEMLWNLRKHYKSNKLYTCKRCQGLLNKNPDEKIMLDGNDMESVDRLSYLQL